MSDEPRRGAATARSTRVVILVGFALLLLGLLTVAVVTGVRSRTERPEPALTATPLPAADSPAAGEDETSLLHDPRVPAAVGTASNG